VLAGIAVGVAISFLEPATENDNLFFVFFCGMIGVSGMTMPGLSGSFILILFGNYVLLLVDSVNALYNTIADIFLMDFSFIHDPVRLRLLKVLVVFSLGSLAGLVTLSHLLGYLLKLYKKETYAVIIGFITGSLGVVWPWKEEIFKLNKQGEFITDAHGNFILDNYQRYFPDFSDSVTWLTIFFILIGILIVLGLGWYENKNSN
jgi:uncharacterized membrane protein